MFRNHDHDSYFYPSSGRSDFFFHEVIISLAFSFGAFMFIRELEINKELNETD